MGDDCAAGLEQQVNAQRLYGTSDHARVVDTRRWLLVRVAHAEAAAKIEIFQVDSQFTEFANKTRETRERFLERLQRCNLRADVRTNSVPPNPLRIAMLGVEFARGIPVQTKFVFVVSCRNMRVAASPDVGVYADGNAGCLTTELHLLR